jgi:hypothetical protein
MRAVLFEGTPEEFAGVEAAFRADGDPTLLTRSIVLPQSRPKAWPELNEEQCHRLIHSRDGCWSGRRRAWSKLERPRRDSGPEGRSDH